MNRYIPLLGSIIVTLSLVYLGLSLKKDFESLPALENIPAVIAGLFFSGALYSSVNVLGAAIWQMLLAIFGQSVSFASAARVFLVTQIAKYLPGNVAHHIGRVTLARKHGIPVAPCVSSMGLEVTLGLAAAISIAAPTVLTTPAPSAFAGWLDIFARSAFLVLTLSALVFILFRRFASHHGDSQRIDLQRGARNLAKAYGLYLLSFILCGSLVLLIAKGLFNVMSLDIWSASGAFAVAWLVGYITPGAPAGIGIREVVLTAMLDAHCGPASVGIALALRFVTTVGDGLSLVIGLYLVRKNHGAIQPSVHSSASSE